MSPLTSHVRVALEVRTLISRPRSYERDVTERRPARSARRTWARLREVARPVARPTLDPSSAARAARVRVPVENRTVRDALVVAADPDAAVTRARYS